jgi:thymidylate synthase
MATLIHSRTGREAVLQVCDKVLGQGDTVGSRSGMTKELRDVMIQIEEPWDTMPTGINRIGLQPAIGALEALCNIAGRNAPDAFRSVSQFFPRATERWDMANYGIQMRETLNAAVADLRRNPMSRQALAMVTHPGDLTQHPESRIRWMSSLCTVGLQFLQRDGALNMTVWMRSNDAWYGLCYDLFQFGQLQCTIADALGLLVGEYVHHATSMHLYERHWDVASQLRDEALGMAIGWEGQFGIGRPVEDWDKRRAIASMILNGHWNSRRPPTMSEQWFINTVGPHVSRGDA